MTLAREKVIEEAKKKQDDAGKAGKKGVSLVVIGMFFLALLLRVLSGAQAVQVTLTLESLL